VRDETKKLSTETEEKPRRLMEAQETSDPGEQRQMHWGAPSET